MWRGLKMGGYWVLCPGSEKGGEDSGWFFRILEYAELVLMSLHQKGHDMAGYSMFNVFHFVLWLWIVMLQR